MSLIHALTLRSDRLIRLSLGAPRGKGSKKGNVRKSRQSKSRLGILAGTLCVVYCVVFGKLIFLGMQPQADTTNIPAGPAMASRPDIEDRNGALLATDIRTFSMYAEPIKMVDVDDTIEKLTKIFPNLDRKSTYRKLSDKRSHFVWLERQLTPKQQGEILALGLPAIGFRPEVRRFYPGGSTAAHVLGYVDIDNHGVAGMEKYLDNQGLSDLTSAGLASSEPLEPVKLSIDIRVQNIVHDVVVDALTKYQSKSAGAVILDIKTGEVLAMASAPDFDPNAPNANGADGWLNRMTNGTNEMGSTFKTFSMAMAMDTGSVKLTDTFDASQSLHVAGFTIHDDRDVPRRWLTVPEIFRYSSNIGTARMIEIVGMDAQRAYLARLGLLSKMQTELPEVKMPSQPKVWKKINSITVAFGHGVATTPLQTAVAGAALMDGGRLIEPTFLPRTQAEADAIAKVVVKPSTSDTLRALFKLNGEQGSGKSADVPGYHVGGKTGTANKVINGKYSHVLSFNDFLGAFPIDNPRYVVFSFCDEPRTGEKGLTFATNNAAPMVRDIITRAAPLLGVQPNFGSAVLASY
ncbi:MULTISPECIES: peptidoglycan D,D-transpeptidase FtsI family protein [Rhizobium]|uniref:Penicillin-binding protein 2 n=1 Tax=Rhizobium rhododendri TaxID=2506430 RepID=A0ABY8IC65_9HYPH|nr:MULTISPECIES: penicillin-binding protein 2 [Rhizobium]MBZ5758550.1 penicillin-binding protein 2 [Rhizobium sp. VS19-DR96]MBZ5764620.1 penicillin-binding protein 2 [Rhizobium sp. VS19-DR129.2]MBZ5772163.1 penicillin-binding protein 2 [Rhizobium sp. VS19-DRK62.2]MBZ5783150.1 penicillin-binding protein 2 [Rhizobium sp. VS19-DR121]MBZ5800598.1 penicillin-binding protein 2 [Rhizobium sp. VS19-DR181]